jgi:hypothetical protein
MTPEDIRTLTDSFRANKLRLLVGAGPSIQSGFPGWDELNLRLVKAYLTKERLQARQTVDDLAKKLCDTLGRDAAADMVFLNAKKFGFNFNELLAQSLYGDRNLDLPIQSSHYQIAVMRDNAAIYTTNFDPLLEMAVAAVNGVDIESGERLWRHYRQPEGARFRRDQAKGNPVVHLHGWLDPGGETGEPVILRESQYQELAQKSDARANIELRRVLEGGATLIIGMSLGDPNLRRLFYFLGQTTLSEQAGIWAVFKKQDTSLDDYVKGHWERLGVKLLFVEEHDEIAGLLRDVQYGACDRCEAPNWIDKALAQLKSHVKTEILMNEEFQGVAYCALQVLSDRVRRFFALPAEEVVGFSLFLPLKLDDGPQASLCEICTSRRQRTGAEAEEHARLTKLSIARGNEQGLAGIAFASAQHLTILDDERPIYRNFSPEMKRLWRSERRDWRSILALPVMDQPSWLPIGVAVATSNYPEPFWTRFGERKDRYQTELFAMMRETARFILGGFKDAEDAGGGR